MRLKWASGAGALGSALGHVYIAVCIVSRLLSQGLRGSRSRLVTILCGIIMSWGNNDTRLLALLSVPGCGLDFFGIEAFGFGQRDDEADALGRGEGRFLEKNAKE